MSDKKYSGPLMGWVNDPTPNPYDETAPTISFRLKKVELEQILERYVTAVDAKGQGGNVWFTIWKQKSGNWGLQVFDPNSEAAQEARAKKAQEKQQPAPVSQPAAVVENDEDDLPF